MSGRSSPGHVRNFCIRNTNVDRASLGETIKSSAKNNSNARHVRSSASNGCNAFLKLLSEVVHGIGETVMKRLLLVPWQKNRLAH